VARRAGAVSPLRLAHELVKRRALPAALSPGVGAAKAGGTSSSLLGNVANAASIDYAHATRTGMFHTYTHYLLLFSLPTPFASHAGRVARWPPIPSTLAATMTVRALVDTRCGIAYQAHAAQ